MNTYTVHMTDHSRIEVSSERVYVNHGVLSFFNNDRSNIAQFAPGVWSHYQQAEKVVAAPKGNKRGRK